MEGLRVRHFQSDYGLRTHDKADGDKPLPDCASRTQNVENRPFSCQLTVEDASIRLCVACTS